MLFLILFMGNFTHIPVRKRTKALLEKMKEEESWDEFLRKLAGIELASLEP